MGIHVPGGSSSCIICKSYMKYPFNSDTMKVLISMKFTTNWVWLISSRQYVSKLDGKYYQRGSIEKDGNRPIHIETIQDEKITIGNTIRHNTTTTIEGNIEGRRSRGRPINTWVTDVTNSTGAKYMGVDPIAN